MFNWNGYSLKDSKVKLFTGASVSGDGCVEDEKGERRKGEKERNCMCTNGDVKMMRC